MLPFVYHHGGGPYVTARAPRTIVLRPAGRAYVLVAKYRSDGGIAHTATQIKIAEPASTRTISLALRGPDVTELDYCRTFPGRKLDPGNVVTVSPIGATQPALEPVG